MAACISCSGTGACHEKLHKPNRVCSDAGDLLVAVSPCKRTTHETIPKHKAAARRRRRCCQMPSGMHSTLYPHHLHIPRPRRGDTSGRKTCAPELLEIPGHFPPESVESASVCLLATSVRARKPCSNKHCAPPVVRPSLRHRSGAHELACNALLVVSVRCHPFEPQTLASIPFPRSTSHSSPTKHDRQCLPTHSSITVKISFSTTAPFSGTQTEDEKKTDLTPFFFQVQNPRRVDLPRGRPRGGVGVHPPGPAAAGVPVRRPDGLQGQPDRREAVCQDRQGAEAAHGPREGEDDADLGLCEGFCSVVDEVRCFYSVVCGLCVCVCERKMCILPFSD